MAGTLMDPVGWTTVALAAGAPVGATATWGAVPVEASGATPTAEAGWALVALALLAATLAEAMWAAGAGPAGAGAWGWPSGSWLMAAMVVVEGRIVVA